MLTRIKIVYFLALILLTGVSVHAQGKIFSIPDSILLFDTGELKIVMPDASEEIPIPPNTVKKGPIGFSSLSADGNLVSWAFPVEYDSSKRWGVRVAVAVYSRSEKQWRTYGDFSQVHTTAISPDGSKVAFLAEKGDSESRELLVLDLNSGIITILKKMIAVDLSWSPNSKKLAIGIPYSKAPKVGIYDIDSGTLNELFEGSSPAWSPTGEWIAYIDSSDQKVRLVHPNGTGDHVLKGLGPRFFLGWYRAFFGMPVWSPDGTKLLLNVRAGLDSAYREVVMLDARTGKMTKKSQNGYIWGWARLRE